MVTDQMIYNYYWNELEEYYNGMLSINAVTYKINQHFNSSFTTKQVMRVILSNMEVM